MPIESLNALAIARKDCRICVERDPGQVFNGSQEAFDPSVISYWSQWLGHEAPKILVAGQDFSDIGYFTRNKGFDEAGNATNDNLRELFAHAGLEVGKPPARDTKAPVFLTNSILCLKSGAMNAPIKDRWVKSCSTNHLVPLLDALRPPIIIGMGKHGWAAVRLALRLNEAPNLIGVAAGNKWITPEGQHVFAVGHCSGLGLVNRAWSQQVEDWEKIGTVLALLNLR
jgi:hypothetical protein